MWNKNFIYYCPGNYVERLRKTTINISQDSRAPGRDMNPEAPENETTHLTAIFSGFQ
jgi:hypothetical protein